MLQVSTLPILTVNFLSVLFLLSWRLTNQLTWQCHQSISLLRKSSTHHARWKRAWLTALSPWLRLSKVTPTTPFLVPPLRRKSCNKWWKMSSASWCVLVRPWIWNITVVSFACRGVNSSTPYRNTWNPPILMVVLLDRGVLSDKTNLS